MSSLKMYIAIFKKLKEYLTSLKHISSNIYKVQYKR